MCNGKYPVSPYTTRSGVLWRTCKSLYRFVLVPDVSCILKYWSDLLILRRSIVGSAFPTALWTIVFEAIMARVDLSFTCLLFSSNRGPWFENITPRYLYLVHSSIRLSLKVKLFTVWVAKYFFYRISLFLSWWHWGVDATYDNILTVCPVIFVARN